MSAKMKWFLPPVLVLGAIMAVSLSGRGGESSGPASFFSLTLAAPVENFFSATARAVENVWRSYFKLVNVQAENERLQAQIDSQLAQLTELNEYKAANKRLEALLEFKGASPDFVLKPAKVVAWDINPWFKNIVVYTGGSPEIKRDLAVVLNQGVVGRLVETGPYYAKVLLANDYSSTIDAFVQRTRANVLVGGQGGGPLVLKYVRKDEDVRPGDQIVTSGLDGSFPPGLLIGTVTTVNLQTPDMFMIAEVKAAVDFTCLEEVLIIVDPRPPIVLDTPEAQIELEAPQDPGVAGPAS